MIKHKPLPPLKELSKCLYLDSTSPSGLRWAKYCGGRSRKNKIAGTKRVDGYWNVGLKKHLYLAHRITCYLKTGVDPGALWVDHINLKTNNLSIRHATPGQNHANRIKVRYKKGRESSSIYKGVYKHTKNKNWIARINVNKKLKHIGVFETEIEAALAYNRAALELWGEFARLNEIE